VTSVHGTLSHRPHPIHPNAAHDINIDTQMPGCGTTTGFGAPVTSEKEVDSH
jgi:hypothetical protein